MNLTLLDMINRMLPLVSYMFELASHFNEIRMSNINHMTAPQNFNNSSARFEETEIVYQCVPWTWKDLVQKKLPRWWFHSFKFSPLFGEDSHFD